MQMFMAEKNPSYASLYFKIPSESDSSITLCKMLFSDTLEGLREENPAWIRPPRPLSQQPSSTPPCRRRGPRLSHGPWTRPGERACRRLVRTWPNFNRSWVLVPSAGRAGSCSGRNAPSLPRAHSLVFAYGIQAKRIRNFRRLDLVEANPGPSHPGALGGPAGSAPRARFESAGARTPA